MSASALDSSGSARQRSSRAYKRFAEASYHTPAQEWVFYSSTSSPELCIRGPSLAPRSIKRSTSRVGRKSRRKHSSFGGSSAGTGSGSGSGRSSHRVDGKRERVPNDELWFEFVECSQRMAEQRGQATFERDPFVCKYLFSRYLVPLVTVGGFDHSALALELLNGEAVLVREESLPPSTAHRSRRKKASRGGGGEGGGEEGGGKGGEGAVACSRAVCSSSQPACAMCACSAGRYQLVRVSTAKHDLICHRCMRRVSAFLDILYALERIFVHAYLCDAVLPVKYRFLRTQLASADEILSAHTSSA
eukprot:TRINITY_DN2103_c0_g1_i1.p1 TRINITY_DN2103_c0_g1~~TRINITY_DN2103_c0_g1_i1.p1  ORF type:complete len:304 (-),score=83.33 TRINITY_DN2103_c0_g1_i1:310-1221(-)